MVWWLSKQLISLCHAEVPYMHSALSPPADQALQMSNLLQQAQWVFLAALLTAPSCARR